MELLSALSCLASALVLLLLGLWLWKELTMGLYTGGARLDGRLVVITGGNCGIGLETARELARRGAVLVVGCRSKARGEAAVRDIMASTGSRTVELVELDLLSLASVRRFAQAVASRPEPLHLLINNAGMVDGGRLDGRSHLSGDGLEIVTQTNHLSHFLLTCLLRDRLAAAGTARVINVSSFAAVVNAKVDLKNINYETDSSPAALIANYNNSKLMNVMFSSELSRRWREQGITSYSCHPGLVRTEVFRKFSTAMQRIVLVFSYLTGKNNLQGAQTTLFLALEPGLEEQAGSYFGDCRNWDFLLPKSAPGLAAGLWDRSAALVSMEM